MKKVLIIAEYFPPAWGVGAFRVTKFVKYLQGFNWQPAVVTVKPEFYDLTDDSLIKDIPENINIYRLNLNKSCFFNHPEINWLPELFMNIGKIIKKENPQIVYITGRPFFPMMIGLYARFFYNTPYVLDFRDAWTLERLGKPKNIIIKTGRFLSEFIEYFAVKYAQNVIFVTSEMNEKYKKAYKHNNHFCTVTNGFDRDDYDFPFLIKFEKFTILYTGTFRSYCDINFRDPTNLFKAVKILQEEGLNINFIHVGKIEEKVLDISKKSGLSDTAFFEGSKSYSETLKYIKSADLSVVIGGGSKDEQTGKIFDYIGCNRPVLALARPDGSLAEVIKDMSFAKIIENDSPEKIASIIREIYNNSQNYSEIIHNDSTEKYARKYLTGLLAGILDNSITTIGMKK